MREQCETCRFWQPLAPGDGGYAADRNYRVDELGDGICRRLPPIGVRKDFPVDRPTTEFPVASDAAMWAQWPVTSGDLDWCGEHAPRARA